MSTESDKLSGESSESGTVDNKLFVVQDILMSGKRLHTHRSMGMGDCDSSLLIDVEELGKECLLSV